MKVEVSGSVDAKLNVDVGPASLAEASDFGDEASEEVVETSSLTK